jgi:hypothetical protein
VLRSENIYGDNHTPSPELLFWRYWLRASMPKHLTNPARSSTMTLRRASNVHLQRHNNWLGRLTRVQLLLGRGHTSFTLNRTRWLEIERDNQPAPVGQNGDRTLWHTAEGWFWEDDGLDAEAVALLLWDRTRRLDARIQRLRKIQDREEQIEGARRERIPPEIRAFVWQRDDGRCVQCNADDDLQFDHVIPVARGGGNAENNLQILCGPCNRQKSDSID